jgi:presequence protease
MSNEHGFELIEQRSLPELNSEAYWYRHIKTGAELLSLVNEDSNKSFGVSFRTPPDDSTGIAHILEHSVLCGSRKYPSKEPFVELLKGSLNTFLNAMTYPDKTVYPVASQNLQDFYNLVDVYLDAVFYPRLTPQVLQQEGWHYELPTADATLSYKGVVFNEMKGANSSPERLLFNYGQTTLFPDTIYRHDSGGNPADIPNLTFDQFQAFHHRFYHPSNAQFYFYGDDNPTERLRLINDFIAEFDRSEPESKIDVQPMFAEPRHVERTYPVAEDDTSERKGMLLMSWLLPENHDPHLAFALEMLEYLLIGTPGAPLRKALIESGLGEDLANSGVDTSRRQMSFQIGMKGTDPDTANAFEKVVLNTLHHLSVEGIDQDAIEAAVNATEFALRENNTGNFPRGLAIFLRALNTWNHDGTPFDAIAFEETLNDLKQRLANGEQIFEELIENYLVKNHHRVTLVLRPDSQLAQTWEANEQAKLANVRSHLTDRDIERVVQESLALQKAQETPDSPDVLAMIPQLTLEDLDRQVKTVPTEVLDVAGAELLYHDLGTNGILYFDLGLDLHTLPQDLLPYIPLFGRALLEMGTEAEDFVRLSQRIDQKTGGISTKTFTTVVRGTDESAAWLFLRGKAMAPQSAELFAILRDVLTTTRFDNQERFLQMVLEEKAGAEAELVPMGHRVVNRRLRARLNEADWANEQMTGVSQLFFLRSLAENVQNNWKGVLATLTRIRNILLNRDTMILNATLDQSGWREVLPRLESFVEGLPTASATREAWSPALPPAPEGLTIPARVNYVGRVADVSNVPNATTGSAVVVSRYLGMSYMWEKVRVQGGAYGGFAALDTLANTFSFLSYRDPNLTRTLDVYKGAGDFLRDVEISGEEVTKGIIGAIGDMDAYQLPDAQGHSALERYIAHVTDEQRQSRREQILATTPADFRAFADVIDAVNQQGAVAVLGSAQALEAAAEEIEGLTITKVL